MTEQDSAIVEEPAAEAATDSDAPETADAGSDAADAADDGASEA